MRTAIAGSSLQHSSAKIANILQDYDDDDDDDDKRLEKHFYIIIFNDILVDVPILG